MLIFQVPVIYRSFNAVYSAWLDVHSGIRHLVNNILSYDSSEAFEDFALREDMTDAPLPTPVKEMDWRSPMPLSTLCPICFSGKKTFVEISFDGNFQQKRLGDTKRGKSVLNNTRRPDLRLFVRPCTKEQIDNEVDAFFPSLSNLC